MDEQKKTYDERLDYALIQLQSPTLRRVVKLLHHCKDLEEDLSIHDIMKVLCVQKRFGYEFKIVIQYITSLFDELDKSE